MASMRFHIGVETLKKHAVRDYFEELKRPVGRAATHAVREAGDTARDRIRSEVRRKFRNRMKGDAHFANSFRSYHSPKKDDPQFQFAYEPATTVLAAAPWADVFEEGATVRPSSSQALAVPLEAAERLGLDYDPKRNDRRLSRTEAARQIFGETFVVQHEGNAFIAAEEGGETLFLFALRRSVRDPKKLSFRTAVEWAFRFMPDDFGDALRRHAPR